MADGLQSDTDAIDEKAAGDLAWLSPTEGTAEMTENEVAIAG
jgi:hypothetical protein